MATSSARFCGICHDSGTVFVAHHGLYGNQRVEAFDAATGRYLRTVVDGGIEGDGIRYPVGLAVLDGHLFITGWDHMVHKLRVNDGKDVLSWGGQGLKEGQFKYPDHITVLNEQLWVADCHNHRLQCFDANGKFIRAITGEKSKRMRLRYPRGVTGDGGLLYVVDGSRRLLVLTPMGESVGAFPLKGASELLVGVSVARSRIFVADADKGRVHVLERVPCSEAPPKPERRRSWVLSKFLGPFARCDDHKQAPAAAHPVNTVTHTTSI